MNNHVRAGALALAATTLNGCGSGGGFLGSRDLQSGEPRISDAVWFQTQDVDIDTDTTKPSNYFDDNKYLPLSCLESNLDSTQKPQIVRYIRPYTYVHQNPQLAICISQMKLLIDRRFEHWIDALNAWNSGSNTILDNTIIGAGIAGTAAGGLASQVFNAISASLTGAKSTVNNDFFYQKSVQIIITQMKTDRAKWDTIIQGRLQATQKSGLLCSSANPQPKKATSSSKKERNKSISSSSERVTEDELSDTTTTTTIVTQPKPSDIPVLPYCNLSEAWGDLETYARQGSFNNALLTLTANVSAQSAACQAENLNVRQASTATTAAGTSSKSTDATATSPCPAPSSANPASTKPANPAKGK